jgi:hypothetical protein
MSQRIPLFVVAFATIALGALTACSDEAESPPPTGPQLTGKWTEIYPRRDASLVLVLHADSSVSGTFTDPDALEGESPLTATQWRIDSRFTPGGLCIRFGEVFTCQGYSVRADTLFLANGSGTVLVRSGAVDSTIEYRPTSRLEAPVPGDSGYR